MSLPGTCLCGKITIDIKKPFSEQVICHCWDCKHTSGSAFSTNILVDKADFTITGDVSTYKSLSDSGNEVSRVFCGDCGSPIYHASKAFGTAVAMQTGNFKAMSKAPFVAELFVKDRWAGIQPISGATQAQKMT